MRLAHYPTPSTGLPCDLLLVMLWHLAVLRHRLLTIGGFDQKALDAWNEYVGSFKDHIGGCAHCTTAMNEFVGYVQTFPIPEPKRKSWIREWSENLVVGTAFNLFGPAIYQGVRDWLNGDDRRR